MSLFGFQAPAFRFRSEQAASALETTLANATDASSIVVPDDLLKQICEAAQVIENRRTIMQHLARCLNETQGSHWRRVYLALAILEDLVSNCELVEEITEGVHFDLGQRMAFLERFEYCLDMRVQNIVRKKAQSVHASYRKTHEMTSEIGPGVSLDNGSQDGSTVEGDSCTDSSSGAEDIPPRRHEASRATPHGQMSCDLLCLDDTCSCTSGDSALLHGALVEAAAELGQSGIVDLLGLPVASEICSVQKEDVASPSDPILETQMSVTYSAQPECVNLL